MKQYSLYNEDPVIRTSSGIWFNAFEPTEEMICIVDIAHALSNQCRFGGHLLKFYSVAQHSTSTALLVSPEHRLAALMHDASEAYLLDIPRPIKNKLSNYKEIEDGLMTIIAKKYGFQWPLHEEVKRADEEMLQIEWDNIVMSPTCKEVCLTSAQAKENFIQQFNLYNEQRTIL
jgi:5'-deoxynucleotidase YfbR-like HD superfamily hydrolase